MDVSHPQVIQSEVKIWLFFYSDISSHQTFWACLRGGFSYHYFIVCSYHTLDQLLLKLSNAELSELAALSMYRSDLTRPHLENKWSIATERERALSLLYSCMAQNVMESVIERPRQKKKEFVLQVETKKKVPDREEHKEENKMHGRKL